MRMSKKRWVMLLMVYIVYLLVGAYVFQVLEAPSSIEEKLKKIMAVQQLQLQSSGGCCQCYHIQCYHIQCYHIQCYHIQCYHTQCYHIQYLVSDENLTDENLGWNWDFWNAFFFSFITITTIGYGHLSPRTTFGQQFCILYSLFGIPLNTMVFVTLAGFYSDFVLTREDREGGNGRTAVQVVSRALVYLMPGLILFLIVPAVIVMEVEGWTFLQSFYFAFISLTTIGYGDFVAGGQGYTGYRDFLYKGYIMLWTMFGLSYLIMIITFLVDALKSDPVRAVEERTARLLLKRTARLQALVNSFLVHHHRLHQNYTPKNLPEEKLVGNDTGQENPSLDVIDNSNDDPKIDENVECIMVSDEEIISGRSRRSSVTTLAGRKPSTRSRVSHRSDGRRSIVSTKSKKSRSSNIVHPTTPEVPMSYLGMKKRSTIVNAMAKIMPGDSMERHYPTYNHGSSIMHCCSGDMYHAHIDIDHHHSDMHTYDNYSKELLTLAALVDKVERLLEMVKRNEPTDTDTDEMNSEEGCDPKTATPSPSTSESTDIHVKEVPPMSEDIDIGKDKELEDNSLHFETANL
ncbi:potassium channel subfamily K member 10-like [Hyalella azteca]|uniref:Potassium channel subfamily K member 10-like n=1 Tax=Hyalella azteca TaxID=294128 RepID=A0A8B7P6J9_HYAAZ|nr:potassium channel subfamily K member 10-like [Hyalella azteca]